MTHTPRYLVVEDDALLLLDLVDNLADLGIESVPMTRAPEAMHRLLVQSFDALITDIELAGGTNGLELARSCGRLRPDLPIVVVSGGVQPRPGDLPPNAVFVPKPYQISDVMKAIRRQPVAHRHAA